MTETHHWNIRGNVTRTFGDGRPYMSTFQAGYLAETIDEAIAICRKHRPGVVIWNINHSGKVLVPVVDGQGVGE